MLGANLLRRKEVLTPRHEMPHGWLTGSLCPHHAYISSPHCHDFTLLSSTCPTPSLGLGKSPWGETSEQRHLSPVRVLLSYQDPITYQEKCKLPKSMEGCPCPRGCLNPECLPISVLLEIRLKEFIQSLSESTSWALLEICLGHHLLPWRPSCPPPPVSKSLSLKPDLTDRWRECVIPNTSPCPHCVPESQGPNSRRSSKETAPPRSFVSALWFAGVWGQRRIFGGT